MQKGLIFIPLIALIMMTPIPVMAGGFTEIPMSSTDYMQCTGGVIPEGDLFHFLYATFPLEVFQVNQIMTFSYLNNPNLAYQYVLDYPNQNLYYRVGSRLHGVQAMISLQQSLDFFLPSPLLSRVAIESLAHDENGTWTAIYGQALRHHAHLWIKF